MTKQIFLKALIIHLFAIRLAYAWPSSWAFQQIQTEKAWELARGRGSLVTVALIDTGIDVFHPDLKDSLWSNPGETGLDSNGRDKATNGIDDDGNGFIDDVHGWNFVTNSAILTDTHGHGTHIAGIIAGLSKSATGTNGIAPLARLMVLKYYDPRLANLNNVKNSIRAFQYAIRMKAQIINYSGGGPGANHEEEKILQEAEKNQILIVAAAGNDAANTDKIRYYPADYPLKNILSVTALTAANKLSDYANFGSGSVHLAAPGDNIRSTLPNGAYGEMSGTSQATAFVTGVAALILSQNFSFISPETLIEKLTASGVVEKSLEGKTQFASRLDAFRALTMKSSVESAAGFIFDRDPEENPLLYTLSSSSLGHRESSRRGGYRWSGED